VYDYTHGGSSTSNGLSNSNAKVELYINGELIHITIQRETDVYGLYLNIMALQKK